MIRGAKKKLESASVKQFGVNTSIHNRFDIEVVDPISGEVKQRAFAENVICNQLWTRLCSSNTYNNYIQYGDGEGTPSASDTSLFSYIGYLSSSIYKLGYDFDNDVFICTKKAVMSETVAVGKTITEVGIAYSTGTTSLVTHAMLKDMNGNSVSLEKSNTDIFNIYATVFIHFAYPSSHIRMTGLHMAEGAYYTNTLLGHLAGLATMPAMYCPHMIGTVPSGTGKLTVSVSYDATNRKITLKVPRLSADNWNTGGLYSFHITSGDTNSSDFDIGGAANIVLDVAEDDGWYGSTHVTGEAIGTGNGSTVDFSTDFGFVKNLHVYVDGAEVSASVDYLSNGLQKLSGTHKALSYPMLSYFRLIRQVEHGDGYYSSYPNVGAITQHSKSSYRCFPTTTHGFVFENLLYETVGVYQIYKAQARIKASNDLKTWVSICSPTSSATTLTVPEEYRKYRYWEIKGYGSLGINQSDSVLRFIPETNLSVTNNVHLEEAPPEGAVITADYDTISVAKDANHVFDLSVVMSFNEYTEAQ